MATKRFLACIACLLVIGLGVAGCAFIPRQPEPPRTEAPTDEPVVMIVTATAEPTARPTRTPAPTLTDTPVIKAAIATLEEVKNAVIQIEAQGSFEDPAFGRQLNVAGLGSGFIIDPSGLAVTNNHVATGAAFLKVWVGGEARARNARVVGASECSDLAVIQIEGDGAFDYLAWYEGDATPGLEVYVAGFPLGDPEYTLTRGIVSKERADGDTDWASVQHVIEHDARLARGNSGGPLVTRDGRVVGINFALDPDTGQSYAIGADVAQGLVAQLASGVDVTSIGVNGHVLDLEELSGIWVNSVKSGSPADRAGVKAGDILLELEGLLLGVDGTMADYCNILRSRTADDVMAVTVLRLDTGEVLEGQINGRELAVEFVLDDLPELGDGEYMLVRDDTGALEMEVPVSWSEVVSELWFDTVDGSVLGPRLLAAPDIMLFVDTYDAEGVAMVASNVLVHEYSVEGFLDVFSADIAESGACASYYGREPYSDVLYDGVLDYYIGCGADGLTDIMLVAAVPDDGSYIVAVWVQFRGTAGEDALIRVLDTFWVPGDLP